MFGKNAKVYVPLRATRGCTVSTVTWRWPHSSPKILTEKMASENSSDSQEERAALLETGSERDELQQCDTVATRSGSRLTLYHWTQSFNSQKVSVFTVQHHRAADSSLLHVCRLHDEGETYFTEASSQDTGCKGFSQIRLVLMIWCEYVNELNTDGRMGEADFTLNSRPSEDRFVFKYYSKLEI